MPFQSIDSCVSWTRNFRHTQVEDHGHRQLETKRREERILRYQMRVKQGLPVCDTRERPGTR